MVNHTFDSNYDANDTVADHLRLYGDCISSPCLAKETPDDFREFEEDGSSYIWYFLAGLFNLKSFSNINGNGVIR